MSTFVANPPDTDTSAPPGTFASTTTEATLNTFTPFPRLPFELRRMIWQFHQLTVPQSRRILRVGPIQDRSKGIHVFSYAPIPPDPALVTQPLYSLVDFAVGTEMLQICQETRAQYLHANPCFLPGLSGQRFYYNPENTVIHIVKLGFYDWENFFWLSLYAKTLKPAPWFSDVKILAMTYGDLRAYTRMAKDMCTNAFVNLKEIVYIANLKYSSLRHDDALYIFKNLKPALEVYQKWKDPSYKLPRAMIFDELSGRFEECT